ncbi:hypothetical protein BX666DRAFT_2006620 [Dichotomocladium elegans]|nr:hypothetical protein BX666DRAFT_2006620 [Dichotomocladium elegans]
MHKMHGVDHDKRRSTKQKQQSSSSASIPAAVTASSSSSDQSKQQQQRRTGPVINKEQQKRIAARAAKAMEKQIRRRRKHWSSFVWGDRGKKALIHRYPNGTQEILVPQTLTPDEEHYEFPPRSRLLKKLANANAERRRLQPSPNPYPVNPSTTSALPIHINQQKLHQQLPPPNLRPAVSPPKPDPFAINEWFSSRKRNQKDLDVVEWIDNVERSKRLLSPSLGHTPHLGENSNKSSTVVRFRNERDKLPATQTSLRYAQVQQHQQQRQQKPSACMASLRPPSESAVKHYVPIRLLRPSNKETTAARTRDFWRGYLEHKSPHGGMVRLVGMFHLSLQQHQKAAQKRLNNLATRLTDEEHWRERHETKHVSAREKLDEFLRSSEQQYHRRGTFANQRLSALEETVERESIARERLENSVSAALQQMSLLEKSIQQQAEQSRTTRKNLQKQLDSVISEIRIIRSSRR